MTKDTTVYRGIQHEGLAKNAEKLVGREIPTASFMSTSPSRRQAETFAGFGRSSVLFEIKAKAGAKAADITGFGRGTAANEKELLFGRNQRFRVTGVNRSGRTPVIQMEAL